MKRREQWRPVLDAQVRRWSDKSYDQLRTALSEVYNYEVEFNSKLYPVEVQLIENTDEYVHVIVGVDDGSLPWLICPLSADFIRKRTS